MMIIGTGRDEATIKYGVQRLRRSVQIGPPVPNLRGRLAEFDAVVMPSRFEGLPLLAVETICAHVPLLAADAPGLREAVPPAIRGNSLPRILVRWLWRSPRSSPTPVPGAGPPTRPIPGPGAVLPGTDDRRLPRGIPERRPTGCLCLIGPACRRADTARIHLRSRAGPSALPSAPGPPSAVQRPIAEEERPEKKYGTGDKGEGEHVHEYAHRVRPMKNP